MIRSKKIVIIGAGSAIAEHCARNWLEGDPIELILVGRNAQRLDRVVKDLRVRGPRSDIKVVEAEFLNPSSIKATVHEIVKLGRVDIVLIAHGALPEQKDCQSNLNVCRETLEINGLSPVLYAEAFAEEMELENQGTIALIGSVAGDRGRKSNYVYGAAKGLVGRYAQGLQHRFAGTGVNVVLIKPGPTDTPMTAHLKSDGVKLASVVLVSKQIVSCINSGKKEIYTPSKWWLIMMIVRHLPRFLFNKLDI